MAVNTNKSFIIERETKIYQATSIHPEAIRKVRTIGLIADTELENIENDVYTSRKVVNCCSVATKALQYQLTQQI